MEQFFLSYNRRQLQNVNAQITVKQQHPTIIIIYLFALVTFPPSSSFNANKINLKCRILIKLLYSLSIIIQLMQIQRHQNPKELWMNHRKIDQQGLILPYPKERQFNIIECITSLENLLAKNQSEGLQIHYSQQTSLKDWNADTVETITYRGYLIGRCPMSNFQESKNTKGGELRIEYKIVRLDQHKSVHSYPYLLLFNLKIEAFECKNCSCEHLFRMFKSSFEAIRSEFVLQVKNKLVFMNKYPKYIFTPHNFTSTRQHGFTPFLRLKYEDYESAEYYEVSEQILVNSLRINCLREHLDFESIRWDKYCEMMQLDEQARKKMLKQFSWHQLAVKIKYICCKCKQKTIWTTKNKVSFNYYITKLDPNFSAQHQPSYDSNAEFAKQCQNKLIAQGKTNDKAAGEYFGRVFGLQPAKLDKSSIRQIQQYQQFSQVLNSFGSWHGQFGEYGSPCLVVVQIQIPRMVCTGCQKEKDGLIYISNLIYHINTTMRAEITKKVRIYCKKKYSVKNSP